MRITPINNDKEQALETDETLMQRYSLGDFAAFERLYQRHKGGLYRYFLRQLGNHALAEDLFQDIWSKVISQAPKYQVKAKFSTWLYTLAHHKLIDHVRHIKVVDRVIETPNSQSKESDKSCQSVGVNELTPHMQIEQAHASAALKMCIQALPLVQKDCFLLKEEAGLSLEVIAHILGANYEACKSRLRYAYENLRQCISLKIGQTPL
jgi:RNA polymerase sigma-70 factor (ECF subfamily)